MHEPNDDQGMMLRWEDHIVPILKHPNIHIRDKALIAVAWEVYSRPTELHRLTFGNVQDKGDHMIIRLTGLRGRDRQLIIDKSTPYLREWMQDSHPVTKWSTADVESLVDADPDTPIWTYTAENERLASDALRRITKRASERADVSADVTLNNIRRSRVFLLVAESGLRPATLSRLLG